MLSPVTKIDPWPLVATIGLFSVALKSNLDLTLCDFDVIDDSEWKELTIHG